MKTRSHIHEAINIGKDSWELVNYEALPVNSSAEKQIEALRADQQWQRDHLEAISARIEVLIDDIEKELW
jgi:hypothetical protein